MRCSCDLFVSLAIHVLPEYFKQEYFKSVYRLSENNIYAVWRLKSSFEKVQYVCFYAQSYLFIRKTQV